MQNKSSLGSQNLLGYLPATIIKQILDQGETIINQTPYYFYFNTVVLYADIPHFIQFSDLFSRKDRTGPEYVQFCLNRFLEQLISIISANGGDIIKFAGDALMVIWPFGENDKIDNASRRALQCALDMQKKVNYSSNEKSTYQTFSVKIGIGLGDCKVLIVGGLLGRFEYLCIGDAIRQACDSESLANSGGETIISASLYKYVYQYFDFEEKILRNKNQIFYKLLKSSSNITKLKTKANAFLIRSKFQFKDILTKHEILNKFIPLSIQIYLNIGQENWSKEIRCISVMFINLSSDFSQIEMSEVAKKVQEITLTIQKCVYQSKGSFNKFLIDDKGSVVLLVWGLPPTSSVDDPINAVSSSLSLVSELNQINCTCAIGITSGICFCGVCGTIGNRREYSVIGDVVNLAANCMGLAKQYLENNERRWMIIIDEKTQELIKNKIDCNLIITTKTKGFAKEMSFYSPITDNNNENKSTNYNSKNQKQKFLFLTNENPIIHQKKFVHLSTLLIQNYNNSKNIIILISGMLGIGKHELIYNSIEKFIRHNSNLIPIYNNSYDNSTFVFWSRGFTTIKSKYFNEISSIIVLVYKGLISNMKMGYSETKKIDKIIKCDLIGKLLIKTGAYKYISSIEQIFLNQKYTVNLLKHFEKESWVIFENSILVINNDVKEGEIVIDVIIDFFIEMIIEYKLMLFLAFSSKGQNIVIPLIFIIKDAQSLDYSSKQFILKAEQNHTIAPLFILLSYQTSFLYLNKEKVPKEVINEYHIQSLEHIHLNPVVNKNKLELFIINHLKVQYGISIINNVNDVILVFLIDKSFKGIPLFCKELINSLFGDNFIYVNNNNELIPSPHLTEMMLMSDYSEIRIPFLIEKICCEMIDHLTPTEVIILKTASVIGSSFNCQTVKQILDYLNFYPSELYSKIVSFEELNLIEILYNLDFKNKKVICKFSFPFLREVLYQTILLEQRIDLHSQLAKLSQDNIIKYCSKEIETKRLEKHLRISQISIANMQRQTLAILSENYKIRRGNENDPEEDKNCFEKEEIKLNLNNLKILLVKQICDKLSLVSYKPNVLQLSVIKSGFIEKKSDGKITWESRFMVITRDKVLYYYTEDQYQQGKVPLALFFLRKICFISIINEQMGSKDNIFTVSVTNWIKKEEKKGSRIFFFSAQTKEDLFKWLITLKFLQVKAAYYDYCIHFVKLLFPLYKKKSNYCYCQKKRVFYLKDNFKQLFHKQENKPFLRRYSLFTSTNDSDFNSAYMPYVSQIFKFLVKYCLSLAIATIQTHIIAPYNINAFGLPKHISHLFKQMLTNLPKIIFKTNNIPKEIFEEGNKKHLYYIPSKEDILRRWKNRNKTTQLKPILQNNSNPNKTISNDEDDNEDFLEYGNYSEFISQGKNELNILSKTTIINEQINTEEKQKLYKEAFKSVSIKGNINNESSLMSKDSESQSSYCSCKNETNSLHTDENQNNDDSLARSSKHVQIKDEGFEINLNQIQCNYSNKEIYFYSKEVEEKEITSGLTKIDNIHKNDISELKHFSNKYENKDNQNNNESNASIFTLNNNENQYDITYSNDNKSVLNPIVQKLKEININLDDDDYLQENESINNTFDSIMKIKVNEPSTVNIDLYNNINTNNKIKHNKIHLSSFFAMIQSSNSSKSTENNVLK